MALEILLGGSIVKPGQQFCSVFWYKCLLDIYAELCDNN